MSARAGRFADPLSRPLKYGVLDRLLGHAVRQAKYRVRDAFDEAMSPFGLTTQRFTALMLIAENPGLTQADIAKVMGIARSGAAAIVVALEERDLVERAPSADARAFALALSPHGREALPDLVARVEAHERSLSRNLSPEEVETLKALLARIGG
ncbi:MULTISPECIES: MarR family transcriptional regulator [Caulobacter]|jgi:DNA-binding MarR family transcriptional regulator|uniref:Transcriptional regulator n=1 Tax=Caulobacter vibrioides OR37 TaxID=1292034 RepID=R0E6A3_CAUVI|nr:MULTISPECIES: MarR family transcriptional regulator [Caulobacter]ENZ81073.1 transcriptional regulator [Caulobacter vibrioides OR37]MBQ1563438.1 MarR family transcriptional regulator [Caulobacter sp.]